MGIAEGVTNINILEWWVKNKDILPNWAVAYKNIILCRFKLVLKIIIEPDKLATLLPSQNYE